MISLFRTRTSWHRPWLCLLVVATLSVATLAGCAGTKERDVLESRLRHQEDMLASYQAQIDRAKTELDIARRESASLRQQLASGEDEVAPTEHVDASFRATGLEFSTLMTGGTNINSSPGDDGLTVVLLPKDPDGAVVKVAGTIEIEAFDLARSEGAQRIGHWTYDAGESHEYWHQGVIQSGYQFELPWQEIPQAEKILLHGRLVAIDGRQFDTTHTVSIEPPDATLVGGSQPAEPQRSPIKQLSAFDDSFSAVRPAHAESTSTAWEDEPLPQTPPAQSPSQFPVNEPSTANPFGHSAAPQPRRSDARAMTGAEFKEQLGVSSPLTVGSTTHPQRFALAPPLPTETPLSTASPVSFDAKPSVRSVGDEPRPFPVPKGQTDASDFAREIPPPIRDIPEETDDWWDSDDWPHGASSEAAASPVRTSDVWTDETIPYRR